MCWIHPTPTESSEQHSDSRPIPPLIPASSIVIKYLCSPGSSALPVSPTPTPAFQDKVQTPERHSEGASGLTLCLSLPDLGADTPSPLFSMDFLLFETKVFVGSSQHVSLWAGG